MTHAYDNDDDIAHDTKPRNCLRRNTIDGILGGVCAGFGDYFNVDPVLIRILYVASVLFLGVPLLLYFILWIFIPSDKRAPYHRVRRRTRRHTHRRNTTRREDSPQSYTRFPDVKSKFRSLETRLQDLERSITSKEWKLRRDFRDLDN